ncbi:MAG TPA: Uma2 family endonuclease [Jatrophihabitantaceae bacterium]
MTASPLPPTHLLTVDEYAALGEDEHGRTELMEGSLVMSPSPTLDHNLASFRLAMQLSPQAPAGYVVIPDVDVDLQLVPRDQPGSSRRPDLLVVEHTAPARQRADGGLLRASEVLIVVEIVSPGSVRTDNIVKRAEYADAGIPHYWIVDLDGPISLLAAHLSEQFGYRDEPAATGAYVADEPFPVRLELDQLR